MRENSGIGKRVVLESMEEGILIKPVVDVIGVAPETDEPESKEMPEPKPGGLRRWFWPKRS
jgi:hypothetical protein